MFLVTIAMFEYPAHLHTQKTLQALVSANLVSISDKGKHCLGLFLP
jgi:hypothetical protein